MATFKRKGKNKGLSGVNSGLSILPQPRSRYRIDGQNGPVIVTKPADKKAN